MSFFNQKKQQIEIEIQWLKDKLDTIPEKKQKHRKDILRQIKERDLILNTINKMR